MNYIQTFKFESLYRKWAIWTTSFQFQNIIQQTLLTHWSWNTTSHIKILLETKSFKNMLKHR